MDGTNTAVEIAASVGSGAVSASEVVRATLERIEAHSGALGAFTAVAAERALRRASTIDALVPSERGPLAGVPFAVKNLVDVAGLPTLAGSKINADRAPAARDGALVRRLESAGAVLVGTLNMGEYAYDFTGRNAHYGPARNPHNPDHMTGGSSSGSGAATGAGLVPFTIGSDTNGSIRVPASFCGVFGLKPTYGRLSRAGSFLFVGSLDHLGPLARSVADLALTYDAMQESDTDDPVSAGRPLEAATPELNRGIDGLRIARAGGYFMDGAQPEALAAVEVASRALDASRIVEIPGVERARAAAFIITSVEGANLHLERLRTRAADYDPETRPRFLAGALTPGAWYAQAQRYRRLFQQQMRRLFEEVDIILAPTTPFAAPRLDQATMMLGGREVPIRPNLGIYTQPFSFIGLPVVNVPVWPAGGGLPLGVQVIAAPWAEAAALRVAAHLERVGAVSAPVARLD